MRLKLLLLLIIYTFFIIGTQFVSAQSQDYTDRFTSSYMIGEDLSAYVTFREEFVNNSQTEVLDRYRVIIPFSDAKDITITVNGSGVHVNYKSTGAHVEADVEFPPARIGEKVVVVTTFTTFEAAHDFGGMKIVTVPDTDPKVEMLGQSLLIPSSWELSSASSPCTSAPSGRQTIVSCNTLDRLYLTFGRSFFFNFDIKQQLKNSTDKNASTYMSLPVEWLGQDVFFYDTDSDLTLQRDAAGNGYLKIEVLKNSDKEIDLSGIYKFDGVDSEDLFTNSKSEKAIWDFSAKGINQVVEGFDVNKSLVDQIYSYLLETYSPVDDDNLSRVMASELVGKSELTSIEYADLAVTLLRASNISANTVVGVNNGKGLSSSKQYYSAWVVYYDEEKEVWGGFDPYFADINSLGEHVFINPDRVSYFVLTGEEDEKIYELLFVNSGMNYMNFFNYSLDSQLLNKEFDFTVSLIAPERVALNVEVPIKLRLLNKSSKAIHPANVLWNEKEISVGEDEKFIWVLPGKSYDYTLKGINYIGLFNTINSEVKLAYKVESEDASMPGEISRDIVAVPTYQTFLPYIFVIISGGLILSGFYLFRRLLKRRKLTHKT